MDFGIKLRYGWIKLHGLKLSYVNVAIAAGLHASSKMGTVDLRLTVLIWYLPLHRGKLQIRTPGGQNDRAYRSAGAGGWSRGDSRGHVQQPCAAPRAR